MKNVYLIIIVIIFSSCWHGEDKDRNNTDNKKSIFSEYHQCTFKELNDSIKNIEGYICDRSNKYLWVNKINKRKISVQIGIYNENCSDIIGKMPFGEKVRIIIGENSFLYNGQNEYPYDSISKVINDVNSKSIDGKIKKEIFLWYPDVEKKIDFSPLLEGIGKYLEIEKNKNELNSLPVFYFIIPSSPPPPPTS